MTRALAIAMLLAMLAACGRYGPPVRGGRAASSSAEPDATQTVPGEIESTPASGREVDPG